jgi:hypothetical protein
MLQQKQHVTDLLHFAQRDQLLLQAEARGVINGAEFD